MNEVISNSKSYDPRMHTAEHILNQTMVRLFNCGRAVSAHIESKKSKCDYKLEKGLSDEEISKIVSQVNSVIQSNLPVKESFISKTEAEGKFNLSKLPGDAGEKLRIIHVGDYDACPCSGIHVKETSEIGIFEISSHGFENGIERIRFKLSK